MFNVIMLSKCCWNQEEQNSNWSKYVDFVDEPTLIGELSQMT